MTNRWNLSFSLQKTNAKTRVFADEEPVGIDDVRKVPTVHLIVQIEGSSGGGHG
ncbi:hypothetical protein ABVF61_07400 [Roseibium sp. HPY-6]|uniref:hypothetical protein n=1 Tax=Roseibium sp. HPY-6 TaxID=3229852 RepID=UPI00338EDA4B